jgi:hypothetical protein
MDPVSPVAQLAVAAISGAAFLISMVVMPFPAATTDSSAGINRPSQAKITTVNHQHGALDPVKK